MRLHDQPDVLRGVALQGQARALLRPSVEPTRSSPRSASVPLAARTVSSEERARAQAHPPGYAEGFALGKQEGRRIGEAEGSADARARVDDALRRALDVQQHEADRQRTSAAAQHDVVMRRLERLHDEFQTASTARLRSLEGDATALAFEAVCRLIGEGAGQGERLALGIAESMRSAREGSILRVRVRPDALPLLSDCASGRALLLAFSRVQWVADPRVEGDGCILDTDIGSVDARMEVQIDRLRRLWSEAISRDVDAVQAAPSA